MLTVGDFGDGATEVTNTTSTTHTYSTAGYYSVSVIAYSVAGGSEDWTISDDWTQVLGSASTSLTVTLPVAVVSTAYSAFALFAIVPLISAAILIVTIVFALRSGQQVDPQLIVAAVALVVVVDIIIVVAVLVVNGIESATNVSAVFMSLKRASFLSKLPLIG